jgi:hypothetical protein
VFDLVIQCREERQRLYRQDAKWAKAPRTVFLGVLAVGSFQFRTGRGAKNSVSTSQPPAGTYARIAILPPEFF